MNMGDFALEPPFEVFQAQEKYHRKVNGHTRLVPRILFWTIWSKLKQELLDTRENARRSAERMYRVAHRKGAELPRPEHIRHAP